MNSFHKNRFAFISITGIGLLFVVLSVLGLFSGRSDALLSIVFVLFMGVLLLYVGIDSLRTKLEIQMNSIIYVQGFLSTTQVEISPVRIDVVPSGRFVKYELIDSAGQKTVINPVGWVNSEQMIARFAEYIQQNSVQTNEQAQEWFKLTANR